MRLIAGWKQSYRLFSVQAAVLMGLADILRGDWPLIQQYMPEGWVKYAALVIIAGRLISQSGQPGASGGADERWRRGVVDPLMARGSVRKGHDRCKHSADADGARCQ